MSFQVLFSLFSRFHLLMIFLIALLMQVQLYPQTLSAQTLDLPSSTMNEGRNVGTNGGMNEGIMSDGKMSDGIKSDAIKLHFINVGEGASTLIQSRELGSILIDTGNPSSRVASYLVNYLEGSLAKLLEKQDVENGEGEKGVLAHLFITHPHLDHFGGVFAILDRFKVKNIYDNGEDIEQISSKEDIYRFYKKAVRGHAGHKSIDAGFEISSGALSLKVLSPKRIGSKKRLADWNSNSLVVRISYGSFTALLMADGNFETEKALLKSNADLRANILQVGHHGAKDATSSEFLKMVSPQVAIISVDHDNIRGYPADETLKRISDANVTVYRTDMDGTVIVTGNLDGTFKIDKIASHDVTKER